MLSVIFHCPREATAPNTPPLASSGAPTFALAWTSHFPGMIGVTAMMVMSPCAVKPASQQKRSTPKPGLATTIASAMISSYTGIVGGSVV
jgi:hypothetical protein